MGDDIRWVGNEGGVGRETEWSATMIAPGSYVDKVAENRRLGLEEMSKDLGSRELLKEAKEAYWYPSEVDVSIRPGWFYHPEEDGKVRSIENLVEIYYRSVGSNSVLLLNIPPDKRGLIHEIDAARIKEFGEYIKQTFAKSYIANLNKTWRATAGESREFEIKKGATVNTLLLQEDIAEGQRVESFTVECFEGGEWRELCTGTTIGYKRLLRFDDCHAERLRITITATRATANIKGVGLYYAEPIAE
jgi:alpha-L-fucosidase